MAKITAQFNRLGKSINSIMNGRIDEVKKIFKDESQIMLNEFRALQYVIPPISTPKKNKQDTTENKTKAIAYAKKHSNDSLKTTKRVPWINRSSRAARGVYAYIEQDEESIATGLYHIMSYGAYLEFANNRKFAALEPIVRGRAQTILLKIKQLYEGD
jgi:hypothetical protein